MILDDALHFAQAFDTAAFHTGAAPSCILVGLQWQSVARGLTEPAIDR